MAAACPVRAVLDEGGIVEPGTPFRAQNGLREKFAHPILTLIGHVRVVDEIAAAKFQVKREDGFGIEIEDLAGGVRRLLLSGKLLQPKRAASHEIAEVLRIR